MEIKECNLLTNFIAIKRLKSLDPPHKGLRNALSQFSLLAGKTQYDNIDSVQRLKDLGSEVFYLLRDHTQTEEKFIWFKYIVPARRSSENKQVLTAFKSNAPAEAFETVKSTIIQVVTEVEWNAMNPG
jgi:uncharacterized protein YktA (UPF0223 family)